MSKQFPAPDVAALLKEIRVAAEQRRSSLAPDAPAEPALSDVDLRRLLSEVEATRVVSAHWPLHADTWLQRIVVFFNKLVRRGLRWYINPIAEQQNAANDATVRALHGVVTTLEEQHVLIARLRARVQQLEHQLEQQNRL